MLINQAEKVYLDNQEAQKVYLGSRLVWELQPDVSEATFTLVEKNFGKARNTPYISIRKRDFKNSGVDPTTVTAITVNGERYDVTKVDARIALVDLHIENADSLTLNGSETLTIHYSLRDMPSEPDIPDVPDAPDVSEATFTLFGRHGSKSRNSPYVSIGKRDFKNSGVDPTTVTAITVNGERYDALIITNTRVDESSVSDVYIYIENADSLELNGSETLTIHYRA